LHDARAKKDGDLLIFLEWSEQPSEHKPHQKSLSHETENNINSLAVEVVFPFANTLVLQDLVNGEAHEQHQIYYEYYVDEVWNIVFAVNDGACEVREENHPREAA
jgi:hypothetical protein